MKWAYVALPTDDLHTGTQMTSPATDGRRHSHARLFMVIGAVLVVGAVVIAGVVISSAASSSTRSSKVGRAEEQTRTPTNEDSSTFSLPETLVGMFSADRFAPIWVSDTESMVTSEEGLFLNDVKTQRRTLLVPDDKWRKIRSSKATLSPSRKYLLCPHDTEPVFRYTSKSLYSVYDIRRGTLMPVRVATLNGSTHERLQYAAWLPTRDSLVLVAANDIYLLPAVTTAATARTVRLTFSGRANLVYNGIPDWVYEEEVITADNTIWTSSDGTMLAYASFNDSQVDVMPITFYGKTSELLYQYPVTVSLRYPKAGRTNPSVAVYVIDLDRAIRGERPRKLVPVPAQIMRGEYILATAGWRDNRSLAVAWMSRHQNHTVISVFDTVTSSSYTVLDEPSVDGTWQEVPSAPLWSADRRSFISVLWAPSSLTDQQPEQQQHPPTYYPHIHRVWPDFSGVSAARRQQLTTGALSVTKILRWDRRAGVIYFMAAPADRASQRHLYSVSDTDNDGDVLPASTGNQLAHCVTCNASNSAGSPCAHNSVQFSGGEDGDSSAGSYYVWTCEGAATVPRVTLHATQSHRQLALVMENEPLRRRLAGKILPKMKTLSVDIGDGLSARVRLLLPPDLDEKASHKYPMLVYTYAGPNSQVISEQWSIGWSYHLVTQRRIIYAMIDARGSSQRGSRLLHAVHRRLGHAEVNDQINVTRKLQQIYGFIDAERTAIWGWSYGGFVTATAMARDTAGVFRCGMSIAPVTNWIYYDTIYTERYMGLPSDDDNEAGYRSSDVTAHVHNFASKQFLLVHGTADDNVHYQQSMMLARALQLADILFSQQTYPDEAHSLSGTRPHHFHTMVRFIESCFHLPRMAFSAPMHVPRTNRL